MQLESPRIRLPPTRKRSSSLSIASYKFDSGQILQMPLLIEKLPAWAVDERDDQEEVKDDGGPAKEEDKKEIKLGSEESGEDLNNL